MHEDVHGARMDVNNAGFKTFKEQALQTYYEEADSFNMFVLKDTVEAL